MLKDAEGIVRFVISSDMSKISLKVSTKHKNKNLDKH
jgi:hypothetical protein